MDEGDGVEVSGREFRIERLLVDGLPPLHLERLGFLAAASRHLEPLVGKRAAHTAEDALPNEIADRTLHHTPGRGGGQKNRLLRAKQRLQSGVNLAVEALELIPAMPDHRPRKRRQGLLRHFDRSRGEKLVVWNHSGNVQRSTFNVQLGGAAAV